jgi:hypothetical protein
MAVTAADARTVDELLSAVRDGGQPKYLLFWGRGVAGKAGCGLRSRSRPGSWRGDHVARD